MLMSVNQKYETLTMILRKPTEIFNLVKVFKGFVHVGRACSIH